MSTKQKRPRTIAALVEAARPEARQLLLMHGLDSQTLSTDGNRWDAASRLAGHMGPHVSEAEEARQSEYMDAFFALGIAIGQLVSPDVFKTGGAR